MTVAAPTKRALSDMDACDLCCCWIAPDGTSHHLNDFEFSGSHCGVAEALGDSTGGRDLDKQGYMHVSYGSPCFGRPQEPTQAQLDRLFDIRQEFERRNPGDKYGPATYIDHYLARLQEKQND